MLKVIKLKNHIGKIKKMLNIIIVLPTVVVLVACGGESDGTPPPTTYPAIQEFIENYGESMEAVFSNKPYINEIEVEAEEAGIIFTFTINDDYIDDIELFDSEAGANVFEHYFSKIESFAVNADFEILWTMIFQNSDEKVLATFNFFVVDDIENETE